MQPSRQPASPKHNALSAGQGEDVARAAFPLSTAYGEMVKLLSLLSLTDESQ